jgi:predicted amidohydrolase YtcJ
VQRLDGHMGLANSRRLRLAGITAETPDPPGGTIVRDASGAPTGILKDNAADLVSRVIPEPSRRDEPAGGAGRPRGSGAGRGDDDPGQLRRRRPADVPGAARPRRADGADVRLALRVGDAVAVQAGVRSGLGDEWIRLGALKILADGSMGSGTAAFFAPTPTTRDERAPAAAVEELERMIRDADAAASSSPCTRSAIARTASSSMPSRRRRRANGPRPALPHRARAGGAQADLPRSRRWASSPPSSRRTASTTCAGRSGASAARAPRLLQLPLVHRAGIPVAFGTDWFVEPLDPRLGLYAR